MEVTGNRLYELLQIWTTKRDALALEFTDCLTSFGEEKKRDPTKVNEELFNAEYNIAEIELAQKEFNQKARTSSGLSLEAAIKHLGVLKRTVKRWQPATTNMNGGFVRDRDSEYARQTISPQEAQKMVEDYTRRLLSLKSQVADANSTRIDVKLDKALSV